MTFFVETDLISKLLSPHCRGDIVSQVKQLWKVTGQKSRSWANFKYRRILCFALPLLSDTFCSVLCIALTDFNVVDRTVYTKFILLVD